MFLTITFLVTFLGSIEYHVLMPDDMKYSILYCIFPSSACFISWYSMFFPHACLLWWAKLQLLRCKVT
jgi:hypothetical protein